MTKAQEAKKQALADIKAELALQGLSFISISRRQLRIRRIHNLEVWAY